MNSTVKTILFWLVIVLSCVLLWQVVKAGGNGAKDKVDQFLGVHVAGEPGQCLTMSPSWAPRSRASTATTRPAFHTTVPANYPDMIKQLQDKGVNITVKDAAERKLAELAVQILPADAVRRAVVHHDPPDADRRQQGAVFGKSRARLLSMQQKKVTFKDVAGVDEAKEELREIIEFLREAQKFQKLGGRIPKGVLLVGPPGTGKTLLARAVAGEANVPFFSISGSDFVEMFVGVGASRVRDLFEQGKKNAPCIIFIDEIDAVGRHRGAGLGGGHDEREQTLNQLLVEMDGFESNEGVILIAATNRPDVLDPALLRPGRFDRRVVVPRPDVRGREEILHVHTRKIPLTDDVDLSILARGTPGFTGADLANMVNEAALLAPPARTARPCMMYDFELAKDKVLMGAERKCMILSEEEKRITAYHEAGHALVAAMVPHADPLHKVTIIPRGMALGVTMQLPIDDKHTYTRTTWRRALAIMMGGRVAEELFLHHDDHRRRQRHRAGHRAGPQDGLRVGHERRSARSPSARRKSRSSWDARSRSTATTARTPPSRSTRKCAASSTPATRRPWMSSATTATPWSSIAQALLEREVLDANEIQMIIEGKALPLKVAPPAADEVQKVLKPEPGRQPSASPGPAHA